MAEELKQALLGNVEVRRDGVPVPGFSSGKALALLCYLAVTGRPHSRPTLAGLLWGDFTEAKARNNPRKALTHLRGLVGSHLSIPRQTVAFNREPPCWLDVEVFGAGVRGASPETDLQPLEAAAELYRCDFDAVEAHQCLGDGHGVQRTLALSGDRWYDSSPINCKGDDGEE